VLRLSGNFFIVRFENNRWLFSMSRKVDCHIHAKKGSVNGYIVKQALLKGF
jgi:hypothetical protein